MGKWTIRYNEKNKVLPKIVLLGTSSWEESKRLLNSEFGIVNTYTGGLSDRDRTEGYCYDWYFKNDNVLDFPVKQLAVKYNLPHEFDLISFILNDNVYIIWGNVAPQQVQFIAGKPQLKPIMTP